MFQGNEVHYFSGSKAVDTLMDSCYGTKAKNEASMLFPNRLAAVNYMRALMTHQLFFRARKLVPKKKEEKDRKDKEAAKPGKDDEDKKKKKKVKLEVHDVQVFSDDKDVYVWVFDPTPLYKKVIGLLMVLGTIIGCLFPLWPMWLRQGVYYLSLAGIAAFGAIVVVAILRTFLFGIIWLATMGRHKLWILPNLTEDCGFFESFQPWYTYEYCPRVGKAEKTEKKKKLKKAKESDHENDSKPVDNGRDEGGNASQGSKSEEQTASEESSVPPSPEGGLRKRRQQQAHSDFVMVKK
ncbi:hypothetical protein KIN20_001280 [Parelaphostrongylus tenuis]|uniref:Translocation protein SEC62 n=1 Tax=Parelaphostrongylus tenuis TaxID=148309 RepID=A0AAD5LVZ1_PARTN|nr:hypothetical protein KIN20_001280 [Parelaphostrongylus tenuis]